MVWIVTKLYATPHFQMFKIIYLKVLYCSKSVMKPGSILKPHYIWFCVISDHIISGLQCVCDYNNSSSNCQLSCFESRTKVLLGASPLALVIDTHISANLTIKHKKQKKNFCNYPDFHTHALIAMPLSLRTQG